MTNPGKSWVKKISTGQFLQTPTDGQNTKEYVSVTANTKENKIAYSPFPEVHLVFHLVHQRLFFSPQIPASRMGNS